MPDIQLCTAVDPDGQVCRVAHECSRHTGKLAPISDYDPPGFDFDPKDGCENYLPFKWEPKQKP